MDVPVVITVIVWSAVCVKIHFSGHLLNPYWFRV